MIRSIADLCAALALLSLSRLLERHGRACSAQVAEIKARPGGRIEPLPEVKPYETFTYAAANLRSPFVPSCRRAATAPTGVRPDLKRPREFLEQFSLDTLKMVGTLRSGPQLRPGADAGRPRAPRAARQLPRPDRRPHRRHRSHQDRIDRDRPRRYGRLHRASRRAGVDRMICREKPENDRCIVHRILARRAALLASRAAARRAGRRRRCRRWRKAPTAWKASTFSHRRRQQGRGHAACSAATRRSR